MVRIPYSEWIKPGFKVGAYRASVKRVASSRKTAMKRKIGTKRKSALNKLMPQYQRASPFPPHKLYKLQYQQRNTLVTTGSSSATFGVQQQWSLNGMFDVDITGSGHQPYGYDALAVAYNRYKVIGITIEFNLTDPTSDGLRFGWQINNPTNIAATLAGVDPDVVGERVQAGKVDMNDSGSQKKTIRFFLPMYKAANLTRLQFNADPDNFTASTGSGAPGSQPTVVIACADLRASASQNSIICTTKLTYHAVFYDRKIMAQS